MPTETPLAMQTMARLESERKDEKARNGLVAWSWTLRRWIPWDRKDLQREQMDFFFFFFFQFRNSYAYH